MKKLLKLQKQLASIGLNLDLDNPDQIILETSVGNFSLLPIPLNNKPAHESDAFKSHVTQLRSKSLEKIIPKIESEGYQLLNPKDYQNNRSRIKLACPKGHKYETSWRVFQMGHRCGKCEDLKRRKPKIQKLPPSKKKNIEEIRKYAEARGYELLSTKYANSFSKPEPPQNLQCLYNNLESLNIAFDRSNWALGDKELDLYLPDHKLAIEMNGIYWHSEKFREKNYHLEKLQACQEKGIQLIQIFEDEWLNRKNQVLNFIESKLGVNNKIFARKCQFDYLDSVTARKFFDENHIQGSAPASCYVGLLYQGELIQAMSFGKHHRQNSNDWLLSRLCTKRGYQIVGGASKLLKRGLQRMGLQEISTFADLRYSEGQVYQALGFEEVSRLKPDYSYVKNGKRFGKQSLKKTPEEKLTGKTGRELRLEQGYLRIYDCGKIKYKYKMR